MTSEAPSFYAWFLHREMLDALLERDGRSPVARIRRSTALRSDQNKYARQLEQWLRRHEVKALNVALVDGTCRVGEFVWIEAPFHWSDVARERMMTRGNDPDVRSSFNTELAVGEDRCVHVHGTFSPRWLTCSTSGVELRGVRTQYVLGHVAAAADLSVEIRPVAIATRLVAPRDRGWDDGDWQQVMPSQVDQFSAVDWAAPVSRDDLGLLRHVPEADVKRALAVILGEPVVPKDWGGEQCDLWTTRLSVQGDRLSAAFLLKGPARFAPMTIAMLGKNGDQLERLGRTAARVLVVQHCHEIRPEVFSLLRSVASDYRDVRRYLLLDGYDTYRLLHTYRQLPE